MLRLLRTRMGVPARTAKGQFCLRRQRERTLERQQPAPQRKQHDCRRDAGDDVVDHDAEAAVHAAIDRADRPRLGDIEDARSEEHTSELQSLMRNSYAVFCLKKKTI